MARPSTAPEGFFRALQFVLSPISFLAKAATGIVLFLVLIAAGLIWAFNAWVSTLLPRPPASRQGAPAEVRELMSRLASISTFQGRTPKETCRRHPHKPSPRFSCTLDFGKTSVQVFWSKTSGRVSRVQLKTSIPGEEQAAYRSAPLRWVDFAAVHGILCPQSPDAAAVAAPLPQRLSQTSWNEGSEARSIVVADMAGCRADLTEIRGNNQLGVSLTYRINPSQRFRPGPN